MNTPRFSLPLSMAGALMFSVDWIRDDPDVRKTEVAERRAPCRPKSWANSSPLPLWQPVIRSWANSSPLPLCSRGKAWADLHLLDQPDTFLAGGMRQIDIVYL